MEQRLLRQQAAAAQLLTPLLYQALTPVAEAMARLDQHQQAVLRLVEQQSRRQETLPMAEQRHKEQTELLLEILQTLQPPAEEQIHSLLAGPPPPPTSLPSSAS